MVKAKHIPVHTMKTHAGSTVTNAHIHKLNRKQEVSNQPQPSAVSILGIEPQHPLNRKPDVSRAGLTFWIEGKSLAAAKERTTDGPAYRLTLYLLSCQRK
jgi:hypothetical protein